MSAPGKKPRNLGAWNIRSPSVLKPPAGKGQSTGSSTPPGTPTPKAPAKGPPTPPGTPIAPASTSSSSASATATPASSATAMAATAATSSAVGTAAAASTPTGSSSSSSSAGITGPSSPSSTAATGSPSSFLATPIPTAPASSSMSSAAATSSTAATAGSSSLTTATGSSSSTAAAATPSSPAAGTAVSSSSTAATGSPSSFLATPIPTAPASSSTPPPPISPATGSSTSSSSAAATPSLPISSATGSSTSSSSATATSSSSAPPTGTLPVLLSSLPQIPNTPASTAPQSDWAQFALGLNNYITKELQPLYQAWQDEVRIMDANLQGARKQYDALQRDIQTAQQTRDSLNAEINYLHLRENALREWLQNYYEHRTPTHVPKQVSEPYARLVETLALRNQENQRLNQLASRALLDVQRLTAENNQLRDAKVTAEQKFATLQNQFAANRQALAEQYATLSLNRYVNVGDINSPEQTRLVAAAAMAHKEELEARAKYLADSLPKDRSTRATESEGTIMSIASCYGGITQHGTIPGYRRIFRFSSESDADAFKELVSKAVKTIVSTTVSASIVLVTVEW